MKVALSPGGKTKGNVAWRFLSFPQVLEGAFCRKSLVLTGRNDQFQEKPGKLPNLTEYIGNKMRQSLILLLDIHGVGFFQTPGLLIDSSGIITIPFSI